MLVGSFGTPDYTGGGSSWVETGVGFVSFVSIAELTMDLRVGFCVTEVSQPFQDTVDQYWRSAKLLQIETEVAQSSWMNFRICSSLCTCQTPILSLSVCRTLQTTKMSQTTTKNNTTHH